jgi:uridine kinase
MVNPMGDLGRVLARQFECALNERRGIVVAIDGPGCCGKSTLAQSIAAETSVVVLETDDFHLPRGAKPERDSPLPYRRWREFVSAATRLARGEAVRFRAIDWDSLGLLPEKSVDPGRIVLVDGIGSLHPDLSHITGYRIWVDGLAPTRLGRVARRNGEAVATSWGEYIPLEQAYLQKFKPWRSADLWVCGAEITPRSTDRSFSRLIEEFGAVDVHRSPAGQVPR